jgi:hypothetical protein
LLNCSKRACAFSSNCAAADVTPLPSSIPGSVRQKRQYQLGASSHQKISRNGDSPSGARTSEFVAGGQGQWPRGCSRSWAAEGREGAEGHQSRGDEKQSPRLERGLRHLRAMVTAEVPTARLHAPVHKEAVRYTGLYCVEYDGEIIVVGSRDTEHDVCPCVTDQRHHREAHLRGCQHWQHPNDHRI